MAIDYFLTFERPVPVDDLHRGLIEAGLRDLGLPILAGDGLDASAFLRGDGRSCVALRLDKFADGAHTVMLDVVARLLVGFGDAELWMDDLHLLTHAGRHSRQFDRAGGWTEAQTECARVIFAARGLEFVAEDLAS